MPIPPRTTLLAEMRLEQAQANEVRRLLSASARGIEADLGKLGKEGNPLTRMQLESQRASIKAVLDQDFKSIETSIAKGKVDAAKAASAVVSRYENQLLEAVVSPAAARRIAAAEAGRAVNNLEASLKRVSGTSYNPLSKQVYKTKKLTDGWVDDIVNRGLVSGWDARRLAKEVVGAIDPNVRGGVSYAANRLARTEINNAYHAASWDRYNRSAIVEEVEWLLSSSHPEDDVCNDYATESPFKKNAVPAKPHPNCYCYIVPRLPTEEEFLEKMFAGEYGDEPWAVELSPASAADKANLGGFRVPTESDLKRLSPDLKAAVYDRDTGVRSGSDESLAIYNYTTNSRRINDSLRKSGGKVTKANQELHDKLQNAMIETEMDIRLTRGVPKAAINDALSSVGGDPNKLVGSTLRDNAFQSTTVDPKIASDFGAWTLNIHAPKGTRGAYLGDLSAFPNQKEFLLPPGSNFFVAGVRAGDRKGKFILDVVLTQDGA